MSIVEHEQALFCLSCSVPEFLFLCGCDGQAVWSFRVRLAAWEITSLDPIVDDVMADFESFSDFVD